jgi:hypothetical protein
VALSRETGDRNTEATSLNSLGDLSLATSRPVQAQTHYTSALILAAQIGDPTEQARAHDGLAHACHAMGNTRQAHQHSQAAFTLYTELGVPEADQGALLLAATDGDYL